VTFEVVIHSANEADYVGYQNNPCEMVDAINVYLPDLLSGFGPYSVMQEWDWSLGGVDDQPAMQTASSNTSIAQISQNSSGYDQATFTPPANGQSQSVTLYFGPGSVNRTDCEACSYCAVPVQSVGVSVPSASVSCAPDNLAVAPTAPSGDTTGYCAAAVSPTGTSVAPICVAYEYGTITLHGR
jgi:hypothetical protein